MNDSVFSGRQREAEDDELIECSGCGITSGDDRDFSRTQDGEWLCPTCSEDEPDEEEWNP